jgi:hypothetical protein
LPQEFETWLIEDFTPSLLVDDCLAALRTRNHEWVRPDERKTRDALAAFDGFEEEGRGLARVIGDEAAVGEDGGELVGEEAEGEGDGEGVGPLVALDNETK